VRGESRALFYFIFFQEGQKMFDNVGSKIKVFAAVSFIMEAIAAVITGIAFLASWGFDDAWWGLLIMILGPVVLWIPALLLYGYGELIENSQKMVSLFENTNPSFAEKEQSQNVQEHQNDAAKHSAINGCCDKCRRTNLPVYRYTIQTSGGGCHELNLCDACRKKELIKKANEKFEIEPSAQSDAFKKLIIKAYSMNSAGNTAFILRSMQSTIVDPVEKEYISSLFTHPDNEIKDIVKDLYIKLQQKID
jgi:hypothetical protein